MPNYDIRLKHVESLLVASIREIVPLSVDLGRSYPTLVEYLHQHNVRQMLPTMRLLYSRYKWFDNKMGIDIETAIPLPHEIPANEQISVHTLAAGLVACTLHRGSDITLGQAHTALHSWIEENRYKLVGPPCQVHLQRTEHLQQGEYVTEVHFPVRRQ